ncbi:MAG: phosphoglycerate dehydrogenase [Candidatus Hydrogenedentota bacterium]|nr:MAG: phosphoglycerate dehydrogenase [Candidatus Hydrogenedentota bacterium]
MPKILVLDNLSDEGVNVFRNAEGFEVDVKPPQKPDELLAIIGEYDGLVVRSGTKVTAEVFENPGKLKVIGRAGVGTDNIDKPAATNAGVVVMNTPGGNTLSTCEHTFALLLSLCRNTPAAHASMDAGRWDRKKFMGTELSGKTLGIVGAGRIGGAVAKRAQAFEMKVLVFDPILTQLKADALGVELVTMDEMYAQADFITIHVPKTPETDNMIGTEQFKKMKSTSRIINCARGGIVNEKELAEALKNGDIAGAGLDVYTSEPFEDNPFMGLDNIVTTPHLAASTDEAQTVVAVDVAQQMIDYLDNGIINNAVNVPSLDKETREKLGPLISLAGKLGRFQSLYIEGRPSSIEIEYSGDIGIADTYAITTAVIIGFLEPKVESVNQVSAPSQLAERGISSSEIRVPGDTSFGFQIKVTVTTDKETSQIAGTLYDNTDPRICSIGGTRMDAVPDGWMVVSINEDKPLVLGRLTSVIGEAKVNIANLTLGRDEEGGCALTLINLDSPLDEDALNQLRGLEHVQQIRQVQL